MTRRTIVVAAATIACTLGSLALPAGRPLVWNMTRSVPTGLYWLADARRVSVGDRVAIAAPSKIRRILSRRGYLPVGVPLLKRVAAVSGQDVCRFRHGITIDGKLMALARSRDTLGRPLPRWSGCRTLSAHEIFTLNPDQPDSFDGRYFGILRTSAVTGRAIPVLTDEQAIGSWVWFAGPAATERARTDEER